MLLQFKRSGVIMTANALKHCCRRIKHCIAPHIDEKNMVKKVSLTVEKLFLDNATSAEAFLRWDNNAIVKFCLKEGCITRKPLMLEPTERVKRLKEQLTLSKVNHEDRLMNLPTLKDAHIYCVIYNLSAQQYGPLLERYIRTKFKYTKNNAKSCKGDCSKDGKNSEVKVSLGGATHTKFNFVQIRPSHDCGIYILIAYHLSSENVESEGELYIFRVPKEDIKEIIASYGGYAHGTIKEHGRITLESLNDERSTKEYALRPTINDECWKALLPFRVDEDAL